MGASPSRPHQTGRPSSPLSLFGGKTGKTLCDAPPIAPPPLPTIESESETKVNAPPPPAAPEGTDADGQSQSIANAAAAVSAVANPGPYEHASGEAKRLVALDTHDGVRVDINKQMSPFMPVVHSFWLGTGMLPDGRTSSYSFLAQVADEAGLAMARVDPGRKSVDGRIHRAVLGGAAMLKLQVGVSSEGQSDQLLTEADFGGMTWTGNLKYGSMGGGIVFGCNYFQAITPRLSLGGEGMYVAANQNLLSNYTAKYKIPAKAGVEDGNMETVLPSSATGVAAGDNSGSSTATANYNPAQGMLSVNYQRVVTPSRVTLGAELQCSPQSLESQVILGAEFNLTRSKVNLCVDGTGKMQSVLEAKLGMAPGSPALSFSAELDHASDTMRFGYGINIGG